jgi:hypothetical protein
MSNSKAAKNPPWWIDEGVIAFVMNGKFRKAIGKGGFGTVYEGTLKGRRSSFLP